MISFIKFYARQDVSEWMLRESVHKFMHIFDVPWECAYLHTNFFSLQYQTQNTGPHVNTPKYMTVWFNEIKEYSNSMFFLMSLSTAFAGV